MSSLKDLLLDELRDLYDAEQQLVKALPVIAATAESDGLRSALESHLEETRNHVKRLEDIFPLLGVAASGRHCEGIAGIVREAERVMARTDLDGATRDAALIAGAQRAEHYEIAGYGTVATWAHTLGLTEIAASLEQTLEEEKAVDQALSDLAEAEVNISAAQESARQV